MVKQRRSAPVVQAVLDAVIERLLVNDETSIRIPEICTATGVNYGSIYHHFGSREGVIDAAYVSMFSSLVEQDIAMLRHLFEDATTLEEYLSGLEPILTRYSSNEERVARLALRVRILAACATRPAMRDAIGLAQARLTNELSAIVERGQEAGWILPNVSTHAVAVFLQSLLFGRIQDDMSILPLRDDDWQQLMRVTLFSLVHTG